ncbi:hypothetical protein QYE76_063563 [Lolium multiflorum]|uniref:Reverse transcriptase Ty1/copia-type domain-containing protein n=1 Tax=Lolium multiflorum TaxID=4521 RepID=A0AAD8S5Y0_LOLMU|nr:hypothetical protein QYE76_063563 [Lolium multiflorum]
MAKPGDWTASTVTKRDEKRSRSLGLISSYEGNVILPADDAGNTEGSMRDDDADHDAFVNAAVEEAKASPAKRSIGGFADEDDLLDWDEGFIEPPSKKAKPDAAPPAAAASEASAPQAAPAAQASTASSLSKGKDAPAAAMTPPSEEVKSSSSKLDGAIKKAAMARQEVDSLKEELGKLKERLKEEETRAAEKDELLRQSSLALLEAANIPTAALDTVPNNSPANGVSMALASHQLTRELLAKGKGALARMHQMIFPKLKQDKTLGQLVEAFAVDTKEVIEVFPVPSFVDDSSGTLPEGDRIQRMKDRIAQMEKDLRSTYALAAIVNKKSEIAADVERYALTELHKATESLNSVYVLNRSFRRSVEGQTPYEAWYGKKPSVEHLRVFGCVAHVKSARPLLRKLDDGSTPMIFIGYEPGSKAYRVYNPVTRRVHISRDVVFDEGESWDWSKDGWGAEDLDEEFVVEYTFAPNPTSRLEDLEEGSEPTHSDSPPATPAAPSPSQQDAVASPPPGVEFATPPAVPDPSLVDGEDDGEEHRYRRVSNLLGDYLAPPGRAERLLLTTADEPSSVVGALQDASWSKAMEEEMGCIEENETWTLADLPPGHKPIGLKWVFKVKRDENGTVVKHKARLVARGFVQREGVDFEEVFAPVARLDSVRLLLAVAAQERWEVHHLDVKSAFLNGELKEEVYVLQPPGFAKSGSEGKVLRLHKALYGLRQAPRAWNAKLDTSLARLGFVKCPSDHAVYTRTKDGGRLLLGVYVDDLIITGTSTAAIGEFKQEMTSMFRMRDLGLLSYYLGIEVTQRPGCIRLGQAAYAEKLLDRMGMSDCNATAAPMELRLKLSKNGTDTAVDPSLYRSIMGGLRYLVHTRPDICFTVGFLSRFMEKPTSEHMAAMKHLLRYIAGTKTLGCEYTHQEGKVRLVGYSAADHGGDIDDRKSTSGGIWLRRLLGELLGHDDGAIELRVDNKSAIALTKNPVFHDRSKHIQIRFHFIRQCIEDGDIDVQYVRTADQLSDALTKSLGRVQLQELRRRIGIVQVKDI